MPEKSQVQKKRLSPDWFVQGVLTKVGDVFDRLTGRGWKPSSSLATSELIQRLKALLRAEMRTDEQGREYVPHNIKLKMQWDKFSADSEDSLSKLENEMLTAMVDFINDNRFYTYRPIRLEVKPDYFTTGVKLYAGFDETEEEREMDIHVSAAPAAAAVGEVAEHIVRTVQFTFAAGGHEITKEIELTPGKRISVGRTKENDCAIDDQSVSKLHASMALNADGRLVVADTGSTNGTFVNGSRIAYGKAVQLDEDSELMFGLVKVKLKFLEQPAPVGEEDIPDTESYKVGEFEFTQRIEPVESANGDAAAQPSVTEAAVDLEGLASREPDKK